MRHRGQKEGQRRRRSRESPLSPSLSSLFCSPVDFYSYLERHAVPFDDARVDRDAHVGVLDLEVVLPEMKTSFLFFVLVSEVRREREGVERNCRGGLLFHFEHFFDASVVAFSRVISLHLFC